MTDLMSSVRHNSPQGNGMKLQASEAIKERHPDEPRDPVRMVANLPLAWQTDQWLTTEWVVSLLNIWHRIEGQLHPDIIGWNGVAHYDEHRKSGDVVIIVSHPLFWQKDSDNDRHGRERQKIRQLFGLALGITIGKVIVQDGGGHFKSREKWKTHLRPLALLPNGIESLPGHWCETRMFIPVKRGRTAFVDDVVIMDRPDVEIKMAGKQLNMKDARMLMAILRLLKNGPVEDVVDTTIYELCRETGGARKAYGSSSVKAILASLNRLDWLRLQVRDKERRTIYRGSLINGLWQDEETHRIRVQLNPLVRRILQPLNYLQSDYIRTLKKESEQWFYMAVTKDKPGVMHYRQLRDVYAEYAGADKFTSDSYRWWVSHVAKPGLQKLEQDGIIKDLVITRSPKKGGHVASWIVTEDTWNEQARDTGAGVRLLEGWST